MNVVKILKYCPKGTKLYSTVFGEVEFLRLTDSNKIRAKLPCTFPPTFNPIKLDFLENGSYSENGECVLFPSKDQRDWNKFRLPVKRGDIMMHPDGSFAFIASGEVNPYSYPMAVCGINSLNNTLILNSKDAWTSDFYIPASEEVKKKLFDKLSETGYKWNADTLELEKMSPKFKEGDVVVDKSNDICLVLRVKDSNFVTVSAVLYQNLILAVYNNFDTQRHISELTLASTADRDKLYSALAKKGFKYNKEQHKFIRQEFKSFDKVLVRDDVKDFWKTDIYLSYVENGCYHYRCTTGHYRLCIPYEGNEYLLGTTDSL